MKRDVRIVLAFKEGLSRRKVARMFGVPMAQVDRALRSQVCPAGGESMKESNKFKKAFDKLAKRYPEAAKELAKEFVAAIGIAEAKAKLKAATQVHTISVRGRGSDGKLYEAVFEAVFPKGTSILSVNSK